MSGHSKWHTIKHKKGALDAKRGKLFTKLINRSPTISINLIVPSTNSRATRMADYQRTLMTRLTMPCACSCAPPRARANDVL